MWRAFVYNDPNKNNFVTNQVHIKLHYVEGIELLVVTAIDSAGPHSTIYPRNSNPPEYLSLDYNAAQELFKALGQFIGEFSALDEPDEERENSNKRDEILSVITSIVDSLVEKL